MSELISREELRQALRDRDLTTLDLDRFITNRPAVRPQVVANISGGLLQGASSDYPVDIYTLDFDVDSFDDESTGIIVDGSNAYLGQDSAEVDPDFVRSIIDAEEINFSTGEPVE